MIQLMDLIYVKALILNILNALHRANPPDGFDFCDETEPLNLAVEQKQDEKVARSLNG